MVVNSMTPAANQSPRAMLLKFWHGLGDAVQFTVVLKHLAREYQGWNIDVVGKRGKHTAFRGLCRQTFHEDEPRPGDAAYHSVRDVFWYENYNAYANCPNSKVTNCLAEAFGVIYDPTLGRYEVRPEMEDFQMTAAYLRSIGCVEVGRDGSDGTRGRYNAVLFHYQGNTSPEKKNLSDDLVLGLCRQVIDQRMVPVILDWDRRSRLPDQRTIFCPAVAPDDPWGGFGSGDAARITAMIAQARAFVGIDSGPGKCASATDTPSIIVWTGHHPVQFHDPAPNTTHIVPAHHRTLPPANNASVAAYFEQHYRFAPYPAEGLASILADHLHVALDGSPQPSGRDLVTS